MYAQIGGGKPRKPMADKQHIAELKILYTGLRKENETLKNQVESLKIQLKKIQEIDNFF